MVVSILLYRCTTWTLAERMEKKARWELYKNATCCFEQIPEVNSSFTATFLPFRKPVKIRRPKHAGYYWRSKDKLISDVVLWTPANGYTRLGQPVKIYIHQICADTGCSQEDLQKLWMIRTDGKRKSGKSVVSTRLDDDLYTFVCVCVCARTHTHRRVQIYIYIYIYIYI